MYVPARLEGDASYILRVNCRCSHGPADRQRGPRSRRESTIVVVRFGKVPDEVCRSFNTPFWPYVLTTTSIGQEALDFHRWRSHVVHWDLSSNPLDLEQRKGRIQR